jgi:hypothetical protein
MFSNTRREFITSASAALLCGAAFMNGRRAAASPFGLPIGLQLYSVREDLARDYEGTLKKVADVGYREVEAAGFFGHTPQQVLQAMDGAGLRCVSAHYSHNDLSVDIDQTIAYNKVLGVEYIICSFPGIRDFSSLKDKSFAGQVKAFKMDDYRLNADQFNRWGAKVKVTTTIRWSFAPRMASYRLTSLSA